MERKIILIILILFGFHLLYSNTFLLIEANLIQSGKFWTTMPEYVQYIVTIFFAGSYSAITVLMLELYPRYWLVFSLAILDLAGVFIKYMPIQELFPILAAVYFAIYTGMIVVAIGMYQNTEINKTYTEQNIADTKINTDSNKGILEVLTKEDRDFIERKQSFKNATFAIAKKMRGESTLNGKQIAKEAGTSCSKVTEIKKKLEKYFDNQ